MHRISKVVILILLVTSSSIAQKKLTLDEVISIALQNNTTLKTSENSLQNYKNSVLSSKMELLPSLNASAGWSWAKIMDEGGKQKDYLGNIVTTPFTETDSRDYNLRVGGSWTIFDGLANYSTISSAENQLQSNIQALNKLKQDIVLQAQTLFYNIIKAENMLKVRKDNLDYNRKFSDLISEKVKIGAVPNADLYAQQVQEGNAELSLINAENDYQLAVSELLHFLSLDVLEEYQIINPFTSINDLPRFEEEFSTIESLVQIAYENRSDIKSKEYNLQALSDNVIAARGGFLPSLSGSYGWGTAGTEISSLFNRNTYSASLSLSIPIFSNYRTTLSYESAKISEINGIEEYNSYKREVAKEVKQSFLNLKTAKKGLEVSIKTLKASEENRNLTSEKYKLGSASIVEVLKADSDYQDAYRNKIDAEFLYLVNKQTLLNSIGKIDNKFLN